MTIKEKIKAEVERLKGLYDDMTNVGSVVCVIFEKLLSFIDSITEEPVSKELNQAAEEYAKGEGLENALGGWEDMSDAFKAGAQWQKEKDSSPSKDLEELINKLSGQFPEVSFAKLSRIAVRVAKWQRMQDVELN